MSGDRDMEIAEHGRILIDIQDSVQRISNTLYGNGREGLDEKVRTNSKDIARIDKKLGSLYAVLSALAAFGAAVGSFLANFWK